MLLGKSGTFGMSTEFDMLCEWQLGVGVCASAGGVNLVMIWMVFKDCLRGVRWCHYPT